MPDGTLYDNIANFNRDTDSNISVKEESRLNEIFRNIINLPTTVVVEKFLAQTMSGTLDMAGNTIDNVGLLNLEGNLDMSSGARDVLLKDDEAAALDFLEGANSYLKFVTTNGAELVQLAKLLRADAGIVIADGGNIGSVSDTDAIAIAADGKLTLSQDATFNEDIIIGNAKYIGSVGAPTAVQIAADGKLTLPFDLTLSEDLIIGDAKYIGSASDPDSAQIEADGDWLFSQKVGIGVTPAEELHIQGSGDIAARIGSTLEGAGSYARMKLYCSETGIAANTIAVWYLDNNLNDVTTNYNMVAEATGNAPVYKSSSPAPQQGTHYLAPNAGDLNTCVHTSGAITGTVKTLEFYYQPWTGQIANSWMWDGDGGVNVCKVQAFNLDLYFCFNGIYNWHPESHTIDTWYHYGITFDGTDIVIYQDNISQKDAANVYQSVNKTWHFGNQAAHNLASDRYLDMIRLRSDVATDNPEFAFPTTDPSADQILRGLFEYDDANERVHLYGVNVEVLINSGTADINLLGTNTTVGDGGVTDYAKITSIGDLSFVGGAGFYPRRISQSAIPAAGTGATQIDTAEMLLWRDSDDGKIYVVYNDTTSGIKSVELI